MKNEIVKIAYINPNNADIIVEINDLASSEFYYGAKRQDDTYVLAEEISFITDDELTNFVNGSYDSNVSDWMCDRGYVPVARQYEFATQSLTDAYGREIGSDIDIADERLQGSIIAVDIRSHMRVA